MVQISIITPVKNSIETTEQTIRAVTSSNIKFEYDIYNDFSSTESKDKLTGLANELPFNLINLEDITDTPSPNYKLVLQLSQKKALELNVPLLIIESDVSVKVDTIKKMLQFVEDNQNTGLLGAITVDNEGEINFPYLKFKGTKQKLIDSNRSLSFCCTLFTVPFLKAYSYVELNETKDWYDTFISKKSLALGFKNFIMVDNPVLHSPHGSRPWKLLKYTNPFKYYFSKLINRRDKI